MDTSEILNILLRKYIYHLRVDECYKMLKLFRDRKFVKIENQKEVRYIYENAPLLYVYKVFFCDSSFRIQIFFQPIYLCFTMQSTNSVLPSHSLITCCVEVQHGAMYNI